VIRVLLADDNAGVRRGLRHLLAITDDIEVVGAARNGAEAIELWDKTEPDLVLMDVSMPILDGIAALRRICDRHPGARILMLTLSSDRDRLADAMRFGAAGHLLKDAEPPQLFAAVRAAAAA
jgi:DNA-binding NarL/FixJ family response regulator